MFDEFTASSSALPSHVQIGASAEGSPSNQPPDVFIDKISMTFDIINEGHEQGLFQQIIEMPKDLETGWYSGVKGAYKGAVRIHAPVGGHDHVLSPWSKPYMLVQVHPKNGEGGYLRIEWNPAKFDAAQKKYLFKQLDDFLDLAPSIVGKAKVTRVDVAVDLPGIQIGDYAFERPKSPIRHLIYRKGRLETLYLGTKAKGQFCIYDKGAQLGDKTKVLTRVEARACPNLAAADLHAMKNPLVLIQVYDIATAKLQLGKPLTSTLHRAVRAEGLHGPMTDFPPLAISKNESAVKANSAAFWTPGKFVSAGDKIPH